MSTLRVLWLAIQIAGALFVCVSMFLFGLVTFAVYELGIGLMSIITRKRYVPFFKFMRMSM